MCRHILDVMSLQNFTHVTSGVHYSLPPECKWKKISARLHVVSLYSSPRPPPPPPKKRQEMLHILKVCCCTCSVQSINNVLYLLQPTAHILTNNQLLATVTSPTCYVLRNDVYSAVRLTAKPAIRTIKLCRHVTEAMGHFVWLSAWF
jgi:hypothetical protein